MFTEIGFILITAASIFLQGICGFGGAPLAMSASIPLVGMNSAKAAVTFLFLLFPLITALKNLRSINLRIYLIMMAFMACGVVAGQLLYSLLPTKLLMLIYGGIVVLVGIIKFFVNTEKSLKKPWNYIALVFAGLMQGVFTSGGPFLVLYATGALSDKNEFRATVSAIWATVNIYLCITMLSAGMYTAAEVRLAGFALIPCLAATVLGAKVSSKLNKLTFLKIVYALLVVSGGILIFNALS